MTYKGFAARVEYSEEDGCFVGHVAGIRDVVGFHGASVAELRTAFEEALDDYLENGRPLDDNEQGTLHDAPDGAEMSA